MATARQQLGTLGERVVVKRVSCPRCNKPRHLAPLPRNFQCADLICKFCGFLAQVKAVTLTAGSTDLPAKILGAAWGPQQEQILAGIYHGLYIVGFSPGKRLVRIDYVPPHVLQAAPDVFQPRNPLRPTARRAGWTGFYYNLKALPEIGIQRIL